MIKRREGGGSHTQTGKPRPQRMEMVEWEQKSLAACDQWAQIFPDDKKTRNIIYKSAYLLYHKNQFKEASDRFRTVISMNPGSKEAEQAANLILDSFNLVEDWKNLKEVSKAFYDQKGLGRTSFKKSVYNIYERASFKLIEVDMAKDKDAKKAADSFMAFYDEFPTIGSCRCGAQQRCRLLPPRERAPKGHGHAPDSGREVPEVQVLQRHHFQLGLRLRKHR